MTSISQTGQFKYGEALQKSFLFYEANRSGFLPNDNRIKWRGDSATKDGQDVGVDLTGGYYDAGDHVKFGFPLASSLTQLAWGVDEYREAYQHSGQLDEALATIKWGTDYILKAHITENNQTKEFWGQVGDPAIDHTFWESPEVNTFERPAFKIDAENPGSDLAAETAAALASASMIFRQSDPVYAEVLLKNAIQLYDFADTYRGKYSDSIKEAESAYPSFGYEDELAWGATWLYKATGDKAYLEKAETHATMYLGDYTHVWEDKSYGTTVLLAIETDKEHYRQQAEQWLDRWVYGDPNIPYTAGGLAWRSQWGSLRLTANTAFLAAIYSDRVNDKDGLYSDFVVKQIDYMLGDNLRNFSYQIGSGDNFALQPHHRGSHDGSWSTFNVDEPNKYVLHGALVGGPKSASERDYEDLRTDYIGNEVALDYNASFTGALAYMYANYGGEPLSDRALDALPEIKITKNITGTSNNDSIVAFEGNDTVTGGSGDDLIAGREGDDWLFGDTGNDTISGQLGDDSLEGGTGEDKLYGNLGDDFIKGNEGADLLNGGQDHDILLGGTGGDTLRGEDGNDHLTGELGDDHLIGNHGNDFLSGNEGADKLGGGQDHDTLLGGEGRDTLRGEDGNDHLKGGNDMDRLIGHNGDDFLAGDEGADQLNGGQGDDTLTGGEGRDTLRGEDDHDRLFGRNDVDLIFGGRGNDFLSGDDGNDILKGGEGNDILSGGKKSDRLSGNGGDDILYGDTGSDILVAHNGDDLLAASGINYGGKSNGLDYLYSGSGNDAFSFQEYGAYFHTWSGTVLKDRVGFDVAVIGDFDLDSDSLILVSDIKERKSDGSVVDILELEYKTVQGSTGTDIILQSPYEGIADYFIGSVRGIDKDVFDAQANIVYIDSVTE